MSTFFAQPYDINAKGFFFDSPETYEEGTKGRTSCYGMPVEEYEVQFIDGETIDAALASALEVNQANIIAFFECEEDWDDDQKRRAIIAAKEIGEVVEPTDNPDDLSIDIYELNSMRELAEQFVDEGLFGDIPDHLANYIDLDAIARDLSFDYSETCIAGQSFIYRSG